MTSLGSRRIIYDISSLARWTGPAVGIARTDRELGLWLRSHRSDAVFIFFDPQQQVFRQLNSAWIDAILSGDALIDLMGMPAAHPERPRRIERVPQALRPAALWVLQFRRKFLAALERLRIRQRSHASRGRVERIQSFLISDKDRATFFTVDGRRRAVLPYDVAVGAEMALASTDVLYSVGASWEHLNVDAVRRLKEQVSFRFVFLCHDIIPLQFPEFYSARDVRRFREHNHVAFPLADCVIFSTKTVEADVRKYCGANGLTINASAVVPFGADIASARPARSTLPSNLEPGRYALFVSTIEPRKGHAMLYRIWRRLLHEGLPQADGFKLVFVGRKGWLVTDLLAEIAADETVRGSLVTMSDVEDATLLALYEGAAFCLYPSLYEGFGLPVIEAFARGKAVIASTGGALPEVVGEFSPCLDPLDEEAWCSLLRRWIADPQARIPYEDAIRTRFRRPTWEETAKRFFQTADALPVA